MTTPAMQSAKAAIRRAAPGRIHDLEIALDDDGVVLTGAANSWHSKQLAQEALLQSGVAVRANRIVVRASRTAAAGGRS